MTRAAKIWVIDDDRSIRWVLEKALNQAEIPCSTFEKADSLITRLKRQEPTAIITDI